MTESLASRELSTTDCLNRLGEIRFGRIVFSRYALPTIRPVNHIVDGEAVIIGANPATTLSPDRQVVTYEADTIDHRTQLGWCVILTGVAEEVVDADDLARYHRLLHRSIPGARDRLIRIQPDIVLGVEYIATADHGNGAEPGSRP